MPKACKVALVLALLLGSMASQAQKKARPRADVASGKSPRPAITAASFPDLAVTYVHVGEVQENGTGMQVLDVVTNLGTVKAKASRVFYYLADTKTQIVQELGVRDVPPLDAGAKSVSEEKWVGVSYVPHLAGDFQVIAVADGNKMVVEANEANNIMICAGPIIHIRDRMQACPNPVPDLFIRPEDLKIEAMGLSPSTEYPPSTRYPTVVSAKRGDSLTVHAWIFNRPTPCEGGRNWSAGNMIEVEVGLIQPRWGTAKKLTSATAEGDAQFWGYGNRKPASNSNFSRVTVPLTGLIAPGEYWLYAKVDPQDQYHETTESNNLVFSTQVIQVE